MANLDDWSSVIKRLIIRLQSFLKGNQMIALFLFL